MKAKVHASLFSGIGGPEVDLEKEIDEYFGDGGQWKSGFLVGKKGFLKFARHFYELGLRRAAEMYDDIEYKRQRVEGIITDEVLEPYYLKSL